MGALHRAHLLGATLALLEARLRARSAYDVRPLGGWWLFFRYPGREEASYEHNRRWAFKDRQREFAYRDPDLYPEYVRARDGTYRLELKELELKDY